MTNVCKFLQCQYHNSTSEVNTTIKPHGDSFSKEIPVSHEGSMIISCVINLEPVYIYFILLISHNLNLF